MSPGAEVVRVSSHINVVRLHKTSIQYLQEEKGSGEAAAGNATEGHGGNSMSPEPSEMCAIQSACFHQ